MSADDHLRMLEAVLFAAEEPMTLHEIARYLPGVDDLPTVLARMVALYADRGVQLVERGGRFHLQTAPDLAHIVRPTRELRRPLSRAALETLAIIAYHEPVTRAYIEEMRGVALSPGTMDVLLGQGWVRTAGRRDAPGRPMLYATTPAFLAQFGLGGRSDLPDLDELVTLGLGADGGDGGPA